MIRSGVLVASVSRRAGGLFESVRRLHMGLQRSGIETAVFACQDQYTQEDLPAWKPLVPETHRVVGPSGFGFTPCLVARLARADRDIIHTHGLWTHQSIVAAQWSRQFGRPYVVSAHGMLDPWALENRRWKKRVALWAYERNHLERSACLRALCGSEAGSMRAVGLRNPICTIPNGVDPPPSDVPGARPWGPDFGRGRKVVVHLGRFHRKKNLVALIRAWGRALQASGAEGAGWSLAVAGWDQEGYAAQVARVVQEEHLGNSVAVLGPMHGAAKHAFFSHASAFVLPSLSEGLPMTVLEGWSYGLPVLMTPECNLPVGFDAGAAIPVTTHPEGVAQGLADLFSMSDRERQEMGQRGKALVAERFSWDVIAMEMKAVYEWLLGGGAPPASVGLD